MSVPVRNVYYLLAYAWDTLEEAAPAAAGAVAAPTVPDLLAVVLASAAERLLRRGLDRGYVPVAEDARAPRGKFDLGETLKRALLHRPAVHCLTDALEADVPHNRAVKAGLARLARCSALDSKLRVRCAGLCRRFAGVADAPLTAGLLARVQLHRNAWHYRLPIEVCRLLLHSLLPDPAGGGRTAFRDFLRDEKVMAALFERFVRNFYRREQSAFPRVGSQHITWQDVEADEEARSHLPRMRTDVCLVSAGRKVVVECKYYAHTLAGGRYDARKLHASHLYQLFAYVQNLARKDGPGRALEGVLLYPTAGHALDLRYTIHGQRVRVATVDLAAEWPEIRDRLLKLIEPAGC